MTMKWVRLMAIAAAAATCLTIPALGQDVTINFTGILNPNVQSLGAYAGFYTGTVNGVASTPGFICDDFNHDIYLPTESWQATATSFSSLATSPGALKQTLLGSTLNLDGYAAIAYLSALMATTPASGQADISAAIWYIGALGTGTYSNGPLGKNSISWGNLTSTAQRYVTNLLSSSGFGPIGSATQAAIAELEGSSLWIYTPTGKGIIPVGDPFPQEFIGSVAVANPPGVAAPEGGGSLQYLALALLACLGAVFLRSRRGTNRQIRLTMS